ncbi:MAG: EamA family transporter [Nitrosomonadales bacterium]|nr:EamA family transporter [Nitrosomonadales bacterium]
MSYFYIFMTIALTVYGQIAIKWQALKAGALPEALPDKIAFLLHLLLNPWVISALAAAFLASVFWMAAMTKSQISHAYPFMGMTFIIVLLASGFFFQEPVTQLKMAGTALIFLGIVVASQG